MKPVADGEQVEDFGGDPCRHLLRIQRQGPVRFPESETQCLVAGAGRQRMYSHTLQAHHLGLAHDNAWNSGHAQITTMLAGLLK